MNGLLGFTSFLILGFTFISILKRYFPYLITQNDYSNISIFIFILILLLTYSWTVINKKK